MAHSIDFTKRQLGRAKNTAQAALDSEDGKLIPPKALAPDMIAQADAFELAADAVDAAAKKTAKEVQEGDDALSELRSDASGDRAQARR